MSTLQKLKGMNYINLKQFYVCHKFLKINRGSSKYSKYILNAAFPELSRIFGALGNHPASHPTLLSRSQDKVTTEDVLGYSDTKQQVWEEMAKSRNSGISQGNHQ